MGRTVLKKLPHLTDNINFADIATCPVCIQEKPPEQFSVREIIHMRKHIGRPYIEILPNLGPEYLGEEAA